MTAQKVCWCGGAVGPRVPGDADGLGCGANIMHDWRRSRGCSCLPAQIVGSGGDVLDQDDDPDCPIHGRPGNLREALLADLEDHNIPGSPIALGDGDTLWVSTLANVELWIRGLLDAHPQTDGGADRLTADPGAARDTAAPPSLTLDRDALVALLVQHETWLSTDAGGDQMVRCHCGWSELPCDDEDAEAIGRQAMGHVVEAMFAAQLARPVNKVKAAWVADQSEAVERGYRAVYRIIGRNGTSVEVNAVIWRCVSAFLEELRDDAAGIPDLSPEAKEAAMDGLTYGGGS